MNIKIIKMPNERNAHIANIKALRDAWVDGVNDDGSERHLGLKEAKHIADSVRDLGAANADVPNENIIDSLMKAGFVLEGHIPSVERMQAKRTALIAVRQIIQDALDQDDPDMIEATLAAYRLALGRVKEG